MKFFRHTLILLFSTISLFAQNQSVSLRGRVVDSADNTPVEFADVIIYGTDGRILTSGTTGADGFEVKGIRADSISVTVRMIGYEPHLSEPFAVTAGEVKDMGTIALKKQSLDIREVTVVADKNQIVYKLDRRTISASSSLTASGGTALDILANVPSVQIDADGELTLRGSSGYLVYVNGKPSPLDGSEALRQIPASSIEDIELITTPSARYKSDGDVGIINIKTSGSSSDMFGGNINLSGSTLGTWSADGRLNFHKGNHTVYAGGTLQDIKSKGDFRQDKITDIDSCRVESHSDGERFRSSRTLVGNAGWQFDDGKRHKFILDLQAGSTRNHRGGDMLYNESRNYMEEAPGMGTFRPESGIFNSEDHYILEKKLLQASLDYTWKISPRGEINASSRLRYDRYSLEYTESNMFTLEGVRDEGTRGYEREHHWDADGAVNYKLEFGSAGKLETGYQYTTYSEHGNYSFKYWDKAVGDFIWDESMNTPFYYRRQNHTLYAMVTEKIGKLDFDAGLRAERVIDEMTIDIKDASRYVKLWDLFPSAHISYDASSAGSFILGYSRRTNRPGIWQREPYITYEDYYTRKVGNPDIKAEYINSAELGYRKFFTKAGSIAATIYWRHRTDVVDWIRLPYQKGVTLDKIVNAGNQHEYGLEFSTQIKPLKWWSTTVNGDIYRFDFKATRNDCHDADGFNYMFGWINHFHVAKNTGIQFDGHFIGPHVLTQGDEKAYCYFDLAAKQQFADGKIALSLVIHDIFHTAVYENFRSTAGLESRTVVRPKFPNILLGITFRFNTTPAKEKGGAITGEAGFEGKEF